MLSKDISSEKERISIYNTLKDIRIYISGIEKETNTKEDLYNCIIASLDAIIDELSKKNTYSNKQWNPHMKSFSHSGSFEDLELIGENSTFYTLEKLLGAGGEGEVYSIKNQPNYVIKIYQDTMQESRKEEKHRHLLAYRNNNIRGTDENGELFAAIPEELIFFPDGRFAGFKMRKVIEGIPIFEVWRNTDSDSEKKRYRVAYNLARTIKALHEQGIVLGDMNPNNFIVDRNDYVIATDCDSFQLTDCITSEQFKCHVAFGELLAPELLNLNCSLVNFSQYSDLFSMAIILFRLLMNNYDPFIPPVESGIGIQPSFDWASAVMNGRCLFIKETKGYTLPNWAPKFSDLPIEIQQLFVRVFNYDQYNLYRKIKLRPSAAEWEKKLRDSYEVERSFLIEKSSDTNLLLSKIYLSDKIFCTERGIQGYSIKGNNDYAAILVQYDDDFPTYAIIKMAHNNPKNSSLLWPGYRLFRYADQKQCIGYLTEKPQFKRNIINLYDFINKECSIVRNQFFTNSWKKRMLVSLNIAKCFQSLHNANYLFRAIDTKDFLVDEDGQVFYTATSMLCDPKSNKGMWKYIAPESIQYLGNEVPKYTEETDNYLMSLLIFEILTGEFPFSRIEQYEENEEVYFDDVLDGKTIFYYNDEAVINPIIKILKSYSEDIALVFSKAFNYWENSEEDIYRPKPQEMIDILSKGIKRYELWQSL